MPVGARASYITKTVIDKGLRNTEEWPRIIDKLVETMVRFQKALTKHIR